MTKFSVRCRCALFGAAVAGLMLLAPSAEAETVFDFVSIVDLAQHNNVTPTGSTLTVVDEGSGQVGFQVTNVTGDSKVEQIYFDDSTSLLGSLGSITGSSSSVNFSSGASPGNVPNGNLLTPPFDATSAFSADNPAPHNGLVNAGDSVTIVYNLADSFTVSDIETALSSGDLRLAIHTPGGDNAEGSSGVTSGGSGPTPIPAPAAFGSGLLLLGLMGVTRLARPRWLA